MKKLFGKMLFLTMLLTMCFGMTVFADEVETPEDEVAIEEMQTRNYYQDCFVGDYCTYGEKTFYVIGTFGIFYEYSDGNWSSIDKDASIFNIDSVYCEGYPREIVSVQKYPRSGYSNQLLYLIRVRVDGYDYLMEVWCQIDEYGDYDTWAYCYSRVYIP